MNQIKIGKFIQLLRKDKNLTQVELANRIGVSDRAISKWENGRGLPDYEYISDLCDELGITFNEFIAGEKIESKDTEIKLEENLATVYKESTKNEKKLFKIKTILVTILIIVLALISMFIIDAHQMRNDRPVIFSTWGLKYYPSVDMHELELEQAIKDFIYEDQQAQIEKRQLENAKGFVELNIFYIESNKADLEYKVSTWVLERIYCEKDGEIVLECGSSIPYLFIVDYDNHAGRYKVVDYFVPKDGNRYEQSLKEIFTSSVIRQIKDFDMSNEIKKLIFKIEEAKDNYYGVK